MPITATYGALLALLVLLLLAVVVRLRRSLGVGLGDGGNHDLSRAIRVHGNAIESAPLFLILLAVYEINGGSAGVLHLFGAVFFGSRILHAWGLLSSSGVSPGRFYGTIGNGLCLLGLAIANLLKVIPG